MIREIIERFQSNENVRYKTYLNRVADADFALSNDIRESVPGAIRKVYPSYTFDDIMNMSTERVGELLSNALKKAEELALDIDDNVKNMQIDNLLNNTGHQMSIVNTNCKIFWEKTTDE